MSQSIKLQKQSQIYLAVENLLQYDGDDEVMNSEIWDEWISIVFGGMD